MSTRKDIYISILLLIIFIALVYFNSLFNGFVWDDSIHIVNNYKIMNFKYLLDSFSHNILVDGYKTSNYYRPLQTISYMVDFKIWGLSAFGFHFSNLLLHILNCALFYFVALLLIKNNTISLLSSIVWALHPVHTQVVSYISGRADILASIFLLLSFYCYIRSKDSKKPTYLLSILSILSFMLSIISKECVLMFPLVLLTFEFIVSKKKQLLRTVPYFILVGLYIVFRADIAFDKIDVLVKDPNIFSRFLAALKILFEYIYIIFFPIKLHMDRSLSIHKYFAYEAFLFITMILALVFSLRHSRQFKLMAFGFTWFILNLIPVLNILPLHATLSENWLYIPSIGLIFCTVLVIKDFFSDYKALLGICICSSLVFGFLTIKQNTIWHDEVRLYNHILKYEPDSYKVRNNLGSAYYEKGEVNKAIDQFNKALKINFNYDDIHLNLAVAYLDQKKIKQAKSYLEAAEDLNPQNPRLYFIKAMLSLEQGRTKEASELLKKTLSIFPDYIDAYDYLKKLLKEDGKFIRLSEDVSNRPSSPEAHFELGTFYLRNSLFYDAIEELSRAIFLKQDFLDAHNNLGFAYAAVGEPKLAIKEFLTIIAIDDRYIDAYINLCIHYSNKNDYEKARVYLEKALVIDSKNKKAQDMLDILNRVQAGSFKK